MIFSYILRAVMSALNINTTVNITKDYIPAHIVAEEEELKLSSLKSLRFKNTYGNDKRFVIHKGQLYVHKNYRSMLSEDVEELYYKALIIAKTEANLARELSKLCNKKPKTIQKYFGRFTFKQIQKAEIIIKALDQYLTNNSLIDNEDLEYSSNYSYNNGVIKRISVPKINQYSWEQTQLF